MLGFFGATKKLKKIKRIAMEKHIVFINELSEFLEITPPLVSFDTSHFPTATTIAQYEVTGDTIRIPVTFILLWLTNCAMLGSLKSIKTCILKTIEVTP